MGLFYGFLNHFIYDDWMQLFKSFDEVHKRIELQNQPHMVSLNQYVESLRLSHPDCFVPDFDPLDGGINAKVLFLLEKPGRKTDRRHGGSGFISRDNDDLTATATRLFLEETRIDRKDTVLWNLIPTWNRTRDITLKEKQLGFKYLQDLLVLLNQVQVIVLVGNQAQRAIKVIDTSKYQIINSFHPSPLVRASAPDKWNGIVQEWKKIKEFIK
jgi:uracil-DNA glycosylase